MSIIKVNYFEKAGTSFLKKGWKTLPRYQDYVHKQKKNLACYVIQLPRACKFKLDSKPYE